MGGVMLELSKEFSNALDFNPDWAFEDLISELDALEFKINSGSMVPFSSPFVYDGHDEDQRSAVARRFNFDQLYLSDSDDDSVDESTLETDLVDLVESGLLELSREHEFKVKEDISNQISALETELKNEADMST
uniref:uncharacterized protein LOC105351554 n=1 Tax=Fragaria vesca subsp. vesca TaxID=101020 RepID=UPI0005C90AD3|nr:PREDICTED: uncharacterized protein LOC105351554 [Fragaria vesca subsp. vesca]